MSVKARILGGEYSNFVSGSIKLNYSAIASTFSLTSHFNSDDPVHRELFKPLSFHDIQIIDEFDSVLITGTIAAVSFGVDANGSNATIEGYSKSGILRDCNSLIVKPSEYNNISLEELATQLCGDYGVDVVIDSSASQEAKEKSPTVDVWNVDTSGKIDTIDQLLKRRASEKGLIISHDNLGRVVITKRNLFSPTVATYREDTPSVSMELSIDGTRMHSQISVIGETSNIYDVESNPQQSVTNDLIPVKRESIKTQKTTTFARDESPLGLVKAERAEQLRNIKLSVGSDRWYWWDGKANYQTIKPNNLIDVIAPNLYLADRTKFFIESVELDFDASSTTSKINGVRPEVYNNADPVNIFS